MATISKSDVYGAQSLSFDENPDKQEMIKQQNENALAAVAAFIKADNLKKASNATVDAKSPLEVVGAQKHGIPLPTPPELTESLYQQLLNMRFDGQTDSKNTNPIFKAFTFNGQMYYAECKFVDAPITIVGAPLALQAAAAKSHNMVLNLMNSSGQPVVAVTWRNFVDSPHHPSHKSSDFESLDRSVNNEQAKKMMAAFAANREFPKKQLSGIEAKFLYDKYPPEGDFSYKGKTYTVQMPPDQCGCGSAQVYIVDKKSGVGVVDFLITPRKSDQDALNYSYSPHLKQSELDELLKAFKNFYTTPILYP